MVDLEQIRMEMQNRLNKDKELHSVIVNADTIDEALSDASVQLDTRVANLLFEVIEKGSDGFMGLGRKPWKLQIYQNPETINKVRKLASEGLISEDSFTEGVVNKNHDGLFFVRHFGSDILIKVIPASGTGEQIDVKDVFAEIKRSDTVEFDEELIKKYVKNGTNDEYNVVGKYKHVQAGDVLISVDTTKDEMKASIVVTAPSMSGAEASEEMIRRALSTQGVIEQCFLIDKIKQFVDNPVYNTPFEVAAAILPVDGRDAYISYNFETDPKKLRAKISESGQINYKELNQIQNVIADQPLATKIQAERGRGGKTIFGRYLEAKNGKDIQINLGTNVKLDRDGVTIKSQIDGEVMLVNGRICVEPVKYLDAVNVKTGDVKFL